MTFTKEQLQAVMTGTDLNHRVEALRQLLGYPVKEHDPQGSRFWYLRPGVDELEAEETCPIAVGFYEELSGVTDQEIKIFLTSKDQQQEIYGHYTNRVAEQQPVMYLLLPTKEATGRVPLVLPNEGGLRQRQIQTFDWNEPQLIARLNRLKQGELPIAAKGLSSVPLVEWVFYEPIKTAKELAQLLAEAARRIEQVIPQVYEKEKADGYLHNLLKSFQRELLPTLQLTSENEKDYSFADIYAQTIAYALFTAKVFSHVKDKREGREKETHFDRESAWQQLPETNPFLRKLFKDVSEREPEELGDELIGAIADIFGILRAAKMDAILSDFQLKMNREDIVIRFYEDFLAAYKPQMRERRGVYYTPEPVVSYMVQSVDILVKEKFNKPLGLADPEVEILEPACGTASFLVYIFRLIYERFNNVQYRELFKSKIGDISWSQYVENHLLTRIYGFELLMAPYAIAHLKISLFLEETGYKFDSGKRLEIILTNTLDAPERKSEVFLEEYISEESDRAVAIKRDQPVMLVIGNPPYSYESENTGEWITSLVRDYYQIDGQPLGERNPKGLQDDYVKFIRFAQWKIQRTGNGILAFITNHGFLDNPTFRGMRQSLIANFDELKIYDLHGNSKKKEKQQNGLPDINVFDIQQGVAIALGVKGTKRSIFHCDLYGSRQDKYEKLISTNIESTKWINLNPQSPFYLLIPQNNSLVPEYNNSWSITDIFTIKTPGIVTARDSLTIHPNEESVWATIQKFSDLSPEQARIEYKLCDDTRDWKITLAQEDLKKSGISRDKITPILYRPFDIQHTYYTSKCKGFHSMPRGEVMHHMIDGENLGLITVRQVAEGVFNHTYVTNCIVDNRITSSNKGYGQVFPLYLYPNKSNLQNSIIKEKRHPNLSQNFLNAITTKLSYTPTPEAIFYYIYAIFHSPNYRTRYAEFLKIDFPRVPLTSNNQLFTELATYGEELVALHLIKSPKLNNPITQFVENNGNCIVDAGHPKYTNSAVIINKKGDKFTGVPESVWNFYLGGYQVCQKWLKDRKGRTLTPDDIQHYQRIVVALKETIELMAKIDAVIPAWPIQ
ncbi:type ISP restriction/modification enzyme [Nostoc sp. FACHB-133]|uniref:type ISP restriction/modification enzyme n=1 Tax=Nostoc sp. FACHB-133 TaxID=2692835 RepID=UPI0016853109|nr:type ISP restriction/modification enzyme [Nostoc sp. FACHB-133]MBD2526431.1 N-6 DNA methylase [Nostoc sp. FACHB-133]